MIDLRLLRDDPDRVRATQRARGEDPASSTRCSPPTRPPRRRRRASRDCAPSRRRSASRSPQAQGEDKPALLDRGPRSSPPRSRRSRHAGAGRDSRAATQLLRSSATWSTTDAPRRRRGRLRRARDRRHPARLRRRGLRARRTTSSSASCSARSTWSAAPRCRARASTSSPASARASSWRWSTGHVDQAAAAGFTPMITADAGQAQAMEGTGFLGQAADEVYHLEDDDLYLVGTTEVAARGVPRDEILDLARAPLRYAGWSPCYRREAGSLRQGHPRHHPRAPVRQGRDVRLPPRRGRRGRAPAAARAGRRRCCQASSSPTG